MLALISNIDTRKLSLELAPFGLEQLHDYEPGGHHPVHLGDVFGHDARYRVVHKLGSGGFANIWLCHDMKAPNSTKYVALKILMAEVLAVDCSEAMVDKVKELLLVSQEQDDISDSICLSLDQFTLHGPNGDHLCFVYPLLGPKSSRGLFNSSQNPDRVLRRLCYKLVQAVGFLHGQGICHGGEWNSVPAFLLYVH